MINDKDVFKKAYDIKYSMEWDQIFLDTANYLKNLPIEQLQKCIAAEFKFTLEIENSYDSFPLDGLTGGHHWDPYNVLVLAYLYKTGKKWDGQIKADYSDTYNRLLKFNKV